MPSNSTQSLEELRGFLEELDEQELNVAKEIKEEEGIDLIAEFFMDCIHEKNVDNLQEGLRMFEEYNITGAKINALHIVIPAFNGINSKPRSILAFARSKTGTNFEIIVNHLRDFGLRDKSPSKTKKRK
uniref:Uncharacterized protein n=1 Tax=viral metagenome TaxID=1070528 RepID=A0A6C0B992_9ZZZZ